MSSQLLARELFAPPGAAAGRTRHLLAQAAGSHARLLHQAATADRTPLGALCAAVGSYVRGSAPVAEKRFLLDAPEFVEALHALSDSSPALADWDALVAPARPQPAVDRAAALARARLGNVVAAVLLRRARDWCGRLELASDDYGRIHLPFCDWVAVLADDPCPPARLLAGEIVWLELDAHEARWLWPARPDPPLGRMPRRLFERMFVLNRPVDQAAALRCGGAWPRLRFERAARLGDTRIRFEPIAGGPPAEHAELTGGILAALLAAIHRHAPALHAQFGQCIRSIQGFELPQVPHGQIASFSVSTSPGIIGFNVPFSQRDEPCLSPYCFMWLGHELGHTLHYHIDDVAYTHGWRFLENPAELTPVIPRYGRSLPVRTLFQVPYVHLFEWWLLMEFARGGFSGLPWGPFDDAVEVGREVRDEIVDAFELIDQHARLTPAGRAVLTHVRQLTAEAELSWRRLLDRRGGGGRRGGDRRRA